MKEKILITGGLGFAGMPITKHLLSKGYNVTVIDKLLFNNGQLSKIKSNKFKFFQFDILDSKKIEKFLNVNSFDIIIHLAAIVGDPACRVNENLTIKTNLDASKKIFSLAKKNKIKKFVFFSTCSNYGLSEKNKLLKETDKLKPLSVYARTKVKFEKYLLKDRSKIQKLVLRISTLYGVSDRMRFDLTINEFVKKVYYNKNFEIYHADTWRPYLNLKDLSGILYKLLIHKKINKNSHVFNVGFSDENYTKRDIVKNISKLLPKNKKFKFVEKDFFDKRNYRVNFDRIKSLGIKKNINLKKGIKEIIDHLKISKKNFNQKVFYNHK
mgnify:CR=1 FL=1